MQARADGPRARAVHCDRLDCARPCRDREAGGLAPAQNGMSSSGAVLLPPPDGVPAGWKSAVSTGTSERGVKPLPPPPEKSSRPPRNWTELAMISTDWRFWPS